MRKIKKVVQKEKVTGIVRSFYVVNMPHPSYVALANSYLNNNRVEMWATYCGIAKANRIPRYYTTFEIEGYEEPWEFGLDTMPKIGDKYELTLNKEYKDGNGKFVKWYITL